VTTTATAEQEEEDEGDEHDAHCAEMVGEVKRHSFGFEAVLKLS
jgi:hypothetical protein